MSPDERRELLELLRLHTDEVKAVIHLNWDRAKSSLTFHVALFTLVGVFRNGVLAKPLAAFLFLFIGISASLCARMLAISHGYYRAARDRRASIETMLNLPVRFGTTGTMRGEPQRWWFKVHNIVTLLHDLIAALALAAGVVEVVGLLP